MKRKRLPPLKSLLTFESAARNLSFSKAAEELFVTPGAVSQQIKSLENFLNVPLFKRLHRRILLTDEGQCLLPGIQSGLDQLYRAQDQLNIVELNKPLTITMPPSFASSWLLPRLKSFRREYPKLKIRIDTSIEVIDLAHSDIDMGIRFGSGDYPELDVEFLLSQEVVPVCSPDLINPKYPLTHPSQLKHYDLLLFEEMFFDSRWPDWQMWLMVAGVSDVDTSQGIAFDKQELLVAAAVDGQGVALVGSITASEDLNSGRLIKPFEQSYPLDLAYYLVTTSAKSNIHGVQNFKAWILDQVRNTG